jgi:hypothetical protein
VNTGLPNLEQPGDPPWTLTNRLSVTSLMATKEGIVRAVTSGGLFLSTNAGASWDPDADPASNAVTILTAGSSGALDAGTGGGGVFVRIGSGPWTASNDGLTAANVTEVAAVGPLTAYAAGHAMHKTGDGGQSWRTVHEGFGAPSVDALAASASAIYAAWTHGGLLRSTDGGVNWTTLTVPQDLVVKVLGLDPGGQLYAVAAPRGPYVTELRFLSSADGGNTWTLSPATPWHSYDAELVALGDGQILVVLEGMYGIRDLQRSEDHGNSWQLVWVSPADGTVESVWADAGGTVYAWAPAPSASGYLHTLFRSTDAGRQWTAVGPSLSSEKVRLAASADAVYVGAPGELLATPTDAVPRWISLGFPPAIIRSG